MKIRHSLIAVFTLLCPLIFLSWLPTQSLAKDIAYECRHDLSLTTRDKNKQVVSSSDQKVLMQSENGGVNNGIELKLAPFGENASCRTSFTTTKGLKGFVLFVECVSPGFGVSHPNGSKDENGSETCDQVFVTTKKYSGIYNGCCKVK